MEFLIVIEPASGGRYEHRVAPGSYVLGREEASCDIPILSPEVSRQHARIHLSAEQCTVEDLGSTAGTSKDGQALEGKQSFPFPVEVSLGTTRLTVSVSDVVEMSFGSEAQGAVTVQPGSGVIPKQAEPKSPSSPNEAGHYTRGREIARGGMGAILEANDRLLGRTVAMKVVLEDRASEDARMRFIREATVLGQLEHPNIIPIHELGKDDAGNLFYTMKMVEGRTLQAIINDLKKGDAATIDHYTLDRLLTAFSKVCDAMAFAHSKGIVHRDLKPENVMVGAFGEVLVMDWGLAKILNDDAQTADELGQQQVRASGTAPVGESGLPSGFQELTDSQMRGSSEDLTMDGAVMGSPQYMPPEQAEGRIADIDERSDIYSLGGILYAILTLRPPIKGKTVIQVLDNVKFGNITPPTEYNLGGSEASASRAATKTSKDPGVAIALPHCPGRKVPGALSAVTMKALSQQPVARYLSVAKLSAEIDSFQHGHATTAENISLAGMALLAIKRHRSLFIMGAVGLVAMAALSIWFVINLKAKETRAKAGETAALEAKETAFQKEGETRKALAKSSTSLAEAALREGDGQSMQAALKDVPEDLRDSTWRYLQRQSDTSIFRHAEDGMIFYDAEPHPILPDVFAIGTSSRKIILKNIRTGQEQLEISPGGDREREWRLAFSPDGSQLALGQNIHRQGENRRELVGSIILFDTTTGVELRRWESPHGILKLQFTPRGNQLLQVSGHIVSSWNPATGELQWSQSPEGNGGWGVACLIENGNQLLTEFYKIGFQIWDPSDGRTLEEFNPEMGALHDLVAGNDYHVAAVYPGSIRVIQHRNNALVARINLPSGSETHVVATPDGAQMISAQTGLDGRPLIQLWRMDTGELLHSYLGGQGEVFDIAIHPVSRLLLASGRELRAWDTIGRQSIYSARIDTSLRTLPVFWNSDDLIFSHKGNHLELRSLKDKEPTNLLPALKSLRGCADVSTDGMMAALTHNNSAHVSLIRAKGDEFETLHTIDGAYSLLRLDGKGDRLLATSPWAHQLAFFMKGLLNEDSDPKVTEIRSGAIKQIHKLDWILNDTRFVGLATANAPRSSENAEERIVQWSPDSLEVLKEVPTPAVMSDLCVSPDGKRFAIAGADRQVHVYNAESLELQQSFRAHDRHITALAWHPKEPVIVTGSEDLAIRFWNLETEALIEEIRGITKPPYGLAFSPSGARLAATCPGDATRVWDL